ncbi:MAG: DUF362 domain-containing protein [Candidatus Cloacimonadota bacterium]|nr:MAG: DUF362 domain-containing protein [Candidatus Cloacimonadota bacterium]
MSFLKIEQLNACPPMVTPVTISFKKCGSYEIIELRKQVDALLEPFEKLLKKIKRCDRVLLKPNLLSGHPSEHAVTTHPKFLEAVLQFFIDLGTKPLIGDSPSPVFKNMGRLFEVTGLSDLERRYNVPLIFFDKTGWEKKSINGKDYPIARIIEEVDYIINLPKVKTHILTLLTLGVKNMYGVIPGFKKTLLHKELPNSVAFSEMNLDVYLLSKPLLTIYDGIVGMDGEGPAAGNPVALNFMLATDCAITGDMFITELLGIEKRRFPLYLAVEKSGIEVDMKYKFFGDPLETYERKIIRLPGTNRLNFLPSILTKTVGTQIWARPRIITKKCANCGKCMEACPAAAIKKGVVRPYFNYRRCINCFCCVEVCPYRAVEIKVSPLVKLGMIL